MRRLVLLLLCAAALVRSVAAPVPAFQTSAKASVLICGGSMMNGDHFSDSTLPAMRAHFAGCKTIALVLHASAPADRDAMEVRMQKAFAHLGVPTAISLHRRDAAGALELLRTADAIWIGGGETFVLLGELHRTGQLDLIRQRVLAGVPYGGASAGANVAGLLVGTTNDFPTAEIPTRNALALFPATINPHHPLPEQKADYDARVGKIKIYLKFNPTETVFGLGNASIAVLHDGHLKLAVGHAWVYRASGTREIKPGEEMPELLTK